MSEVVVLYSGWKTHCKNGHSWAENAVDHCVAGRKPTKRCKACLSNENKGRRGYMREWQLARKERLAGRPRPERCEVCGNTPLSTDSGQVLCWDHDHESGVFRGWICNSCNTILGVAGDNPRILKALVGYLEARPKSITRTKLS